MEYSSNSTFEQMQSREQNLTFDSLLKQFERRKEKLDMQGFGLINNNTFTNLAYLLSDQCTCTIKTATFLGIDNSQFQDRKEFSGSLFQQMDDVFSYLSLRNNLKATFEGLYRCDLYDYPIDAIREALLNCLIHKDYSLNASTFISVYKDRIEFISAGGLISDFSLSDLLLGMSICRNPKLASIFYRLNLIEAYGTGLTKIRSSYKNTDLEPIFETSKNVFKVTLPNLNYKQETSSLSDSSNYEETEIIKILSKKSFITRSDIEKHLNISQATANRRLSKMLEKGLIYKRGNGKNTTYYKQNSHKW